MAKRSRCPSGLVWNKEKRRCDFKRSKTDWRDRGGYSVDLTQYRRWAKKQPVRKLRSELEDLGDRDMAEIVRKEIRRRE